MMEAIIQRFACIGLASDAEGVPTAVFPVAAYPVETEPSVFEKRRMIDGTVRQSIRLTLLGDAAAIRTAFRDDVSWYLEETVPDDGNAARKTRYDQSDFCLAGDVVDHRDGRVTIYMAQKTDAERRISMLEEENAQLLFENLTRGTY